MKKMELKDYLAKIAIESGATYDEKKAIDYIEDKAHKLSEGETCVAVSDETVALWFKEYLENPEPVKEEKQKVEEVKEQSDEEKAGQIKLELFDD